MDFPELGSSPAEMEEDWDKVYKDLSLRFDDLLRLEFSEKEIYLLREWGLIS